MSSKNRLIIFGIVIISIILLFLIYIMIPKVVIEVNGSSNIKVNVFDNYIDEGANAYYKILFKEKKLDVETIGAVNTNKLGLYTITYKVNYKNKIKEVSRKVLVVDTEKPNLTLRKDINICQKNGIIEIEADAYDNYDGNITDNIHYNVTNNMVYISVTDSSNNTTEISKKLNYRDNEKPTITLNGVKEMILAVGEKYTELGATAYDSCDGDITNNIKISGKVNTQVIGTYEIEYKVKDSVNNEVSLKRIVKVKGKIDDYGEYAVIHGATIYLTFDDGPGAHTEELLSILDKYNIKATFFVTNQLPKYQDLIKKEYEKGHTIGIHTYSHKWSVYSSVDTYLEDFEKIQNIVINQTGVPSKIFRFPGGSSNTVSRSYCKGIMTKLAKLMTEKGYIYYDWTFDSGDTSKTNNSIEAIINNVKKNLKGDGEYIVLMHDIKHNTILALPEIIEYAKEKGYTFAALNESVNPPHFKIAN